MSSTQQPSATQTYLATPYDALLLLEAVRQGMIPRTTRRLTRSERERLVEDGAVFVWEERETQMQRWTDGKRWSCSRVMGEFLGYEQIMPGEVMPGTRSNLNSSRLEGGLIKQTYSTVLSEGDGPPLKYHIVSYHRSSSVDSLKRPSSEPFFSQMDLGRWHTLPASSSSRSSSPRLVHSSSSTARPPTAVLLKSELPSPPPDGRVAHPALQVNIIGPSCRTSRASAGDGNVLRSSFDSYPRGYHHPHRSASSSFPPPHHLSSSSSSGAFPKVDLPTYGDPRAARYHPYQPSYTSAPLPAKVLPHRRAISPTPSLSNSTDSSRCSSPKHGAALASCSSLLSVSTSFSSSLRTSGSRLWPPPRPTHLAGSTGGLARSPSLPVGDLILPPNSALFSRSPSHGQDPSAHPGAYHWRSVSPSLPSAYGRSALAAEDERMLSRLQFRI